MIISKNFVFRLQLPASSDLTARSPNNESELNSDTSDSVKIVEEEEDCIMAFEKSKYPEHIKYVQTAFIRESHNDIIYGGAFNCVNRKSPEDPLLFVTCSGRNVTIYQCRTLPPGKIDQAELQKKPTMHLLQSFRDADTKESFYCCAWSCFIEPPAVTVKSGMHRQQIVAVAGLRGVIRILCPSLSKCLDSLVGHGAAINELKFHPNDPSLLFSFSKDNTARLWNIVTHSMVAVFGGMEGHRAEVLHGDISLNGDFLITASMDHTMKIWQLDTPPIRAAVAKSFKQPIIRGTETHSEDRRRHAFPTHLQHFPDFTTMRVHGNYVDCVRWFGGLVISKSCEDALEVWVPGPVDEPSRFRDSLDLHDLFPPRLVATEEGVDANEERPEKPGDKPAHGMTGMPTEERATLLNTLKAENCDYWYVRFDLHLESRLLAVGTSTGNQRIYVYDLNELETSLQLEQAVLPVSTMEGRSSNHVEGCIRQTRFTADGRTIIAVGDKGIISRFDRDE